MNNLLTEVTLKCYYTRKAMHSFQSSVQDLTMQQSRNGQQRIDCCQEKLKVAQFLKIFCGFVSVCYGR
jgi:hypothetical protein